MNKQPPTIGDADLERLLGPKGRHGDTMVAHISPQKDMVVALILAV